MRAVLLLALFASLAFAFVAPVITRDDLPVLDDRIVEIVNSDVRPHFLRPSILPATALIRPFISFPSRSLLPGPLAATLTLRR